MTDEKTPEKDTEANGNGRTERDVQPAAGPAGQPTVEAPDAKAKAREVIARTREAKGKRPLTKRDMMNRARAYRELGRAELKKLSAKDLSLVERFEIGDTAVASVFLRTFPETDRILFVLWRFGSTHFDVPSKVDAMNETVNAWLDETEVFFNRENTRLLAVHESLLKEANDKGLAYFPQELFVIEPAETIAVQIRSPYAKRLLDIFKRYDECVLNLRRLRWCSTIVASEIDRTLLKHKREIFRFKDRIHALMNRWKRRDKTLFAKKDKRIPMELAAGLPDGEDTKRLTAGLVIETIPSSMVRNDAVPLSESSAKEPAVEAVTENARDATDTGSPVTGERKTVTLKKTSKRDGAVIPVTVKKARRT